MKMNKNIKRSLMAAGFILAVSAVMKLSGSSLGSSAWFVPVMGFATIFSLQGQKKTC